MSKQSKDPMGDRMKSYELCTSQVLMSGSPKIIRLDGKAFHTWTKKAGCRKPFDKRLMDCMAIAAKAVMKEIGGIARFAYLQSDECTIVINDRLDFNTQPWFSNKVEKIVSVAAAIYSVHFTLAWQELTGDLIPAAFDARVFQVPSLAEMHNAVLWRQFDASKNSVSSYAQSMFSHSQLQGKKSAQMQDMMFNEHGFNWNDAPTWSKRGILIGRFTPNDVHIEQGCGAFLTVNKSLKEYWEIPLFNKEQHYLQAIFQDYKEAEANINEYTGQTF